ncbi:tetratricopeptide repeat protein [Hyphobacterium sp. HN65]|uniref:Tetratricopeptide repeat protein n=1 Tax=Hyphobacterium lacteum TaxID=3116575 RepID=A0ABU7LQM7_9PROT|nr:tetratricopeptide repeat protein [Hyphobacterium sp. HN65]MEE2525629.1 tetratricopeptide repeat protein [Hyphobacterium sp. HN65]
MVCRVLAALFLFLLVVTGQASAQEADPAADTPSDEAASEDDAPAPLLRNLELIDAEAQNNALALEEVPETDLPSTAAEVDEIFNRAQLAYATGEFETAHVQARTAAAAGHAQAATLAGLMHENGEIEAASDVQAVRWYRRAASQGEPVGNYRLGLMAQAARAGLAPAEARSFFQRAAQAGHVPAMLAYALLLKASPVPQDAPLAIEWAERAAQEGNVEAMFQLAQMYDGWERGPQEASAARDWYVQAAENNHAEAALQAGLMLAAGEGGEADPDRAMELIRQSAEAGFAPAMGQYGLMLYQGWDGGEPDLTNAAEWFAQGAIGGDAESQFLYAYVSATGQGTERDLVRAYYWALMAEYEMDGLPARNVDRDRLQAQLETALTPTEAEQVRSQIAAYRAR